MKKLLLLSLCVLFLAGCETVKTEGKYKEGTYTAHVTDNYGGQTNVVSAVIYVNEKGLIKSVFLDSTYTKKETVTTKKTLGSDYGMKNASNSAGKIPGGAEWDTQVKNLENKVVLEQGLDWVKWTDDKQTKTDSVANVTLDISKLYEALSKAIEQAK